jgi:hypothetical protein
MSESVDYAFYKVAVAERDHERVVNARLSVENHELALLVRRLALALRKAQPEHSTISDAAMEYLRSIDRAGEVMRDRPCTCHPDDNPPSTCPKQYALGECRKAASQPVAWRVECKWRDPRLDQTWRKYADYGTRKAAESSQQVFANRGDIEARIVPLYAGEPEESR